MAKLTAEEMKVFAEDAPTAEIAQIGSFKAGAPLKTKDIATMQALSEYADGLSDITGNGANLPLLEDINGMYFLLSRQLTYLFQAGIPEWNTDQLYFADVSIVQVDGAIYRSRTGTGGSPNVGNDPTTDAVNWKPGISDPLWASAEALGSALAVSPSSDPAIAALNGRDIAVVDSTNAEIQTYRFNGSVWATLGTAFAISGGSGNPALAALNGTDVAFIDNTNDDLRTYRFNFGTTTWSQVGNDLNIATVGIPALAALNGTDVAFIDDSNADLRTYGFDGSDWVQVGNDLNIATVGKPALTALNATDVAFIDGTNDDLRTYRFDGADWAQVGSDLNITAIATPAIAAMNGRDIALVDGTNDVLQIYRFDGSAWAQVGIDFPFSNAGEPSLAALNGIDVASFTDQNGDIQAYRFGFSLPGMVPHHP